MFSSEANLSNTSEILLHCVNKLPYNQQVVVKFCTSVIKVGTNQKQNWGQDNKKQTHFCSHISKWIKDNVPKMFLLNIQYICYNYSSISSTVYHVYSKTFCHLLHLLTNQMSSNQIRSSCDFTKTQRNTEWFYFSNKLLNNLDLYEGNPSLFTLVPKLALIMQEACCI